MPNIKKEDLVLNDKVKFDSKGGAILGVLEGPVADFIHPTRNGRHYSEDLWEKVFKNPLVVEQLANGGIPGELDHPAERSEICSEKIAVMMPEAPVKKNGEYIGKFNILDTPCGRIVYTLAKAGFRLGVSSRGSGDVHETYEGEEVDPDSYEFTCFDVVLLPAVESARMKLVTEGLDTKKVNYKKLLKEELEKSNDKDRETMEETLNHMGIDLEEDMAKKKCVICGKEFEGYGNNAQPVKDGLCCDECNQKEVIPARLKKAGLKEDVEGIPENPEEPVVAEEPEPEAAEIEPDKEACIEKIKELLHTFLAAEELEGDEDAETKFVELFLQFFPKLECDSESCADIEPEVKEPEEEDAVADGASELLDNLTKALQENSELKDKLKESQNQTAVSDAKVEKLNEELTKFKNIAASVSKRAIRYEQSAKETTTLQEKVSMLNENLEASKKTSSALEKRVDALIEKNKDLLEKLQLAQVKSKEQNQKLTKLEEKLNNSNAKVTDEVTKLNSQLQKAKQLTEQYKRVAYNAVDSYISSKATMLGVTPDEIKGRLNESYSIKDVDAVCESLQDFSLRVSNLPISLEKSRNAKVSLRESNHPTSLSNAVRVNDDDEVDDYLLDIANSFVQKK